MVLVCNDPAFIFLKTRKTAGTSVEMALEPFCVPPGTKIVEARPEIKSAYGIVGRRKSAGRPRGLRAIYRPFEWRNHRSAAFVRRGVGKPRWEQSIKLATVRNPFDRAVSQFRYGHKKRIDLDQDFSTTRELFRTFVESGNWTDDREVVYLDGKLVLDHVVCFEKLVEDVNRLPQILGLPVDRLDMPHTKSTATLRKSHDVPDYFCDSTIAVVRRKLGWLIDEFGYATTPQPRKSDASLPDFASMPRLA